MDQQAIREGSPPPAVPKVRPFGLQMLDLLASLRLTVVLFVLSLILVFYGTWAQKELGTWTAVNTYFRSEIAWIPLRVLCFYAFDEATLPKLVVPFPGGWLLGALLMVNLLAAHAVRFRFSARRSGVLLLHAGLIAMMLGELITGLYAIEGHMAIRVGDSANFVEHNDRPEIAFVKKLANDKEEVVAVPGRTLQQALHRNALVQHPDLPVDLRVVSFMKNSTLREKFEPADNPANRGEGLKVVAIAKDEGAGAASEKVDVASAYVEFLDKTSGKSLGVYLMSIWLNDMQEVNIGGTAYDVGMRFKRSYRPYTMTLTKFEHKKFVGVNIAKDFRAHVDLSDPERKVEMKGLQIYMNNPFTYRGETFYQSAVLAADSGTVFQVVRNPGGWFPYVSCIMVTLGMIVHFGLNLAAFIDKKLASARRPVS